MPVNFKQKYRIGFTIKKLTIEVLYHNGAFPRKLFINMLVDAFIF